jgi:sugar-specific transcriptional regulator TrmB
MLTELKNIGLADKEARVYLAMLELGPATVLDIAAKAGVNRPTAYVQIESLKKMGLASTQTKGKKQLFIAESPTQLEHIVATEKQKLAQAQDELAKVLPGLTAMFALGEDKPVVRYFEGKEGLLAMQEEFLKVKDKQIFGIFSADAVVDLFPTHTDDYSERRIKKGIKSKSIYTSRKGPVLQATDKTALRESKYIPTDKFNFNADITIFDNNVAITSLQGSIGGAIITHSNIAQSFKSLFSLVWDSVA